MKLYAVICGYMRVICVICRTVQGLAWVEFAGIFKLFSPAPPAGLRPVPALHTGIIVFQTTYTFTQAEEVPPGSLRAARL